MRTRPVPRNIDKPNRTPEFVLSFIAAYYGTLFITGKALVALLVGFLAVYIMYKVTLDKPEGLFLRILYRYLQLGSTRPTPKFCKKLEV